MRALHTRLVLRQLVCRKYRLRLKERIVTQRTSYRNNCHFKRCKKNKGTYLITFCWQISIYWRTKMKTKRQTCPAMKRKLRTELLLKQQKGNQSKSTAGSRQMLTQKTLTWIALPTLVKTRSKGAKSSSIGSYRHEKLSKQIYAMAKKRCVTKQSSSTSGIFGRSMVFLSATILLNSWLRRGNEEYLKALAQIIATNTFKFDELHLCNHRPDNTSISNNATFFTILINKLPL